jgi:hypothetical protein
MAYQRRRRGRGSDACKNQVGRAETAREGFHLAQQSLEASGGIFGRMTEIDLGVGPHPAFIEGLVRGHALLAGDREGVEAFAGRILIHQVKGVGCEAKDFAACSGQPEHARTMGGHVVDSGMSDVSDGIGSMGDRVRSGWTRPKASTTACEETVTRLFL